MSNEEWFPEIVSDLVLFYEVYGVEKDGVKDTVTKAITSDRLSYDLAPIPSWEKEIIDINTIRHITTPHYPTNEIAVYLPKGDLLKGKRLVLGYDTCDNQIEKATCYEWIAIYIETRLNEATNEIEKEYLKKCAEKCRKLELCADLDIPQLESCLESLKGDIEECDAGKEECAKLMKKYDLINNHTQRMIILIEKIASYAKGGNQTKEYIEELVDELRRANRELALEDLTN